VVKDITLRLVHGLVGALDRQLISICDVGRVSVMKQMGLLLTQLRLKQSCEQKKLSLRPSFRQVGHWREPASFSQSTPRHFFLAGGSEVMMNGRRRGGTRGGKVRRRGQ
jgi:hypothetical protein